MTTTHKVSPRIASLPMRNTYPPLEKDITGDITILGGGIAGCATAYFLLTQTERNITLLDASKIAHGASGNNAGLCSTYFERDIQEYIMQYGYEKTIATQKGIFDTIDVLEEMINWLSNRGQNIPYYKTHEYTTLLTTNDILHSLQTIKTLQEGGVSVECLFISEEAIKNMRIPSEYDEYYTILPHLKILELAKANDNNVVAVEARNVIISNTALLCDQLIHYLLHSYSDRFSVYEHTAAKEITLHESNIIITTNNAYNITTNDLILCTNGFSHFTITDKTGKTQGKTHPYHNKIRGYISYMAGFLSEKEIGVHAHSYTLNTDGIETMFEEKPYYYLTTRPKETKHLICIGGEETTLDEELGYNPDISISAARLENMKSYIHKVCSLTANQNITQTYTRHGTIGYTEDGLRIVGPDLSTPHLRYNIGCNGIGVIPSIYGAKRLCKTIQGEQMSPCLFDTSRFK